MFLLSTIECYHYGDIDAGGFYILNHLRERTGINFVPYMMDVNVLKKYEKYCKRLTSNDKKRLGSMLENNSFKEFILVIKYMLDNDIKLEQEATVNY